MPAGRARREDSRFREQAQILAARLRAVRTSRALTQEQLAGRAQVAVSTLRKIESGRIVEPGYFTMLSLADALDVDFMSWAGTQASRQAFRQRDYFANHPAPLETAAPSLNRRQTCGTGAHCSVEDPDFGLLPPNCDSGRPAQRSRTPPISHTAELPIFSGPQIDRVDPA